jgi:MFS family permease
MFSVSQAGLLNNLNDGLTWGAMPLLFTAAALSIRDVGALVAIYPAVWGLCQLLTGPLSDRLGRKWLIVSGMVVQGIALLAIAGTQRVWMWAMWLAVLGVGTAIVYPTLLAAVADIARPSWRGLALGVYRLWRDLGYVIGAVGAGVVADAFGIAAAIASVGALTVGSGLLVAIRFQETRIGG